MRLRTSRNIIQKTESSADVPQEILELRSSVEFIAFRVLERFFVLLVIPHAASFVRLQDWSSQIDNEINISLHRTAATKSFYLAFVKYILYYNIYLFQVQEACTSSA